MLNAYLVFQTSIFTIAFIIMWIGSNKVIDYAVEMSKIFKMSKLFMGFIFIGLATALPELAVVLAAVFGGVPEMAAGNIIGANFNNISLVLGVAAFFGGGLYVEKKDKKNLFLLLLIISLIFLFVFGTGNISALHGIAIIIFYFVTFLWMWKSKTIVEQDLPSNRDNEVCSMYDKLMIIFKFAASIFVVLIAAELTVNRSEVIANMLNLTTTIFGATIFSIVTTVPELVLSSSAIRKNEHGIALGTLIGSVLPHICLCFGLLTILSNQVISVVPLRSFSVFIFAAILIIGLSLWFKNKISKFAGVALLLLFALSLLYHLFIG